MLVGRSWCCGKRVDDGRDSRVGTSLRRMETLTPETKSPVLVIFVSGGGGYFPLSTFNAMPSVSQPSQGGRQHWNRHTSRSFHSAKANLTDGQALHKPFLSLSQILNRGRRFLSGSGAGAPVKHEPSPTSLLCPRCLSATAVLGFAERRTWVQGWFYHSSRPRAAGLGFCCTRSQQEEKKKKRRGH